MTAEDKPDLTAVLRRVQKLLAIAQDSRGNPNEVAAAAAQAEKIMRKYQIDYAEVLSTKIARGEGEEFGEARVNANMKRHDAGRTRLKRVPAWAQWLAVPIAKLNSCECSIRLPFADDAVIMFYGFKSDVQVAAWMFNFMVDAMIRNTKAWQKIVKRKKTESEAYRRGFVQALLRSLAIMQAERDAAMRATSSSTALVVVKEHAIAKHYGEAKYDKSKNSEPPKDILAFLMGIRDGDKVDVARRAVENSASSPNQIGNGS